MMAKPIRRLCALLCVLAIMALAVTGCGDSSSSQKNEDKRKPIQEAPSGLQEVFPEGTSFKPLDVSQYSNLPDTVTGAYRETTGIGYIIELTTTGYSAGMVIRCGVYANGVIAGVTCLSSNETMGKETEYGEQFIGKDAAGVENVDTISGATYTTLAYKTAIKDAIHTVQVLNGAEVDLRPEEETSSVIWVQDALGAWVRYHTLSSDEDIHDDYVDLVIEDVINDLIDRYDYSRNYAENMVYYGGLNIYSAEDPEIQAKIQAVYEDESNFPAHIEGDEEEPQAAFFCVDYDGKVIATVGGRGTDDINRSTDVLRSPGAAIKPLSAYSYAIQNNLAHYSTLLRDAPITLANGSKWPKNYGQSKATDRGDVLLGVALQKSLNTTVVRLMEAIGIDACFDFLRNTYHLSTLATDKIVEGQTVSDQSLVALSLGAFSDGVTAREMTAAYAVFGNGGYYNEPYTYYYVTRASDGENAPHLLDKGNLERGGCNTQVALDSPSAYVMNCLLQRVTENRSGSTGWLYLGEDWKDWQVYGKTGTSENDKDVYFCGGTAYYCASSWFGYDGNQELSIKTNPRQTYYAKILWSKAMQVLHEDLQIKEFEAPSGVEELTYCTKTGLIANGNCQKTDTGVYKTSFKPDTCTCGVEAD